MRIISSYRDYYDPIMKIAADHETKWVRDEEIVKATLGIETGYLNRLSGMPYHFGMVGFCGKVHLFIEFHSTFSGHICYSPSEVDNYVAKHGSKQERRHYEQGSIYVYRKGLTTPRGEFAHRFASFKPEHYAGIFAKYGVPIWVYTFKGRDRVIKLNTQLSTYDFARIVDPYTAFQELYMWRCNEAEPRKPIPPISDVDMRDIKGFDKYSFKKPPRSK